jgi:hypothetical protein
MNRWMKLLHEHKLALSALLALGSIALMALSIMAVPNKLGQDGRGPLAFLKGINYIIIIFMVITVLAGLYFTYRYLKDRGRFEELMGTESQAIFKKNQIEIERLALRLTSREERRVVDAIKRYRIK